MKLRRNDVVLVGSIRKNKDGKIIAHDTTWMMYGRVVCRVSPTEVRVVDCGKYYQVIPDEFLEKQDYKGRWDDRDGRYYFMPTLRKLKQRASCYNRKIWKNPKPRRGALKCVTN